MVDDATTIDQSGWAPHAAVTLVLKGQRRPWADRRRPYSRVSHVAEVILSALPDGTVSGKPTVAMCAEVGEELIVAEVTLAALLSALDAIVVAYGDPREES